MGRSRKNSGIGASGSNAAGAHTANAKNKPVHPQHAQTPDGNSRTETLPPDLNSNANHELQQQQQEIQQEQLQQSQQRHLQIQQQQRRQRTEQELLQLRLQQPMSLREWILIDRRGMNWVLMCVFIGALFGFILGATYLDTFKKQSLANVIRSTSCYQIVTGQTSLYSYIMDDWVEIGLDRFGEWASRVEREVEEEEYSSNIGHARVFAILREAIIREIGGYVHPDLGFLVPAPCGAVRGIGMIRNSYHSCQVNCFPGGVDEKVEIRQKKKTLIPIENRPPNVPRKSTYRQEEVLVVVPLGFQMTRKVAIDTLLPLLPNSTSSSVASIPNLQLLDDAALLTLLLAHERGVGRYSRWMPYIATLPQEPMCGYFRISRPSLLDAMRAYQHEYDVDVEGWDDELLKATIYSERIVDALNQDYGSFINTPSGIDSFENIKWSLCQVASRATAGSEEYGSLRLIPLIDLINHDSNAGGMLELNGTERIMKGDIIDGLIAEGLQITTTSPNLMISTPSLAGAFVVRSLRHGRRKPLRARQELLMNYNVPHYSPLDWFVSMGFVPPERWGKWLKIDPGLPKVAHHHQNHQRRYRATSGTSQTEDDIVELDDEDELFSSAPSEQLYQRKEAIIRQHLKNLDIDFDP